MLSWNKREGLGFSAEVLREQVIIDTETLLQMFAYLNQDVTNK